jgi:hypothetical protein
MYNPFKTQQPVNPTPDQVQGWKNKYGKKLAVLEIEGKTGYVREPTENESRKIVKKLTAGGRVFSETKFMKMVMEVCWLGGDKELINNDSLIEKNLNVWETL